jgi:hypothetical protein
MKPAMSPHGYPTHRIGPDAPNPDAWRVFGSFSFPLINTSRADMIEATRRNDWGGIMGLTWFCHRPPVDQRPCGFCNPCINAMREGFGWRIPRSRRLLSKLYQATLWPLRKRARKLMLRRRLPATNA